MKTLTTISKRKISVSSNKSKRTFTIRTEVATYRTTKMTKEEFISCENNTGNDWQQFLNSTSDYFIVKKY